MNQNNYHNYESSISKSIIYFVLIFVSLFTIYPIVYVIAAAFTPGNSIGNMGIIPFSNGFTMEHFTYLFTQTNYVLWFRNTLIIAIGTALTTVITCSFAAYVFSQIAFRGRKFLLTSFLVLQVFPSFVGMIAIYVILWRINGLNTLWGMVLVYTAANIPYSTWLVKNYIDAIPGAINEAARIDGANPFQLFFRVTLPSVKPIATFLGLTSFAGPWMDFIFPKMVLRSNEMQTLALGLYSYVTDKKAYYTTFAAGAILIMIPFIIFFTLGQKKIISSLSGAVKE